MAEFRLKVYDILSEFAENVYYNPPEGVKMQYPCIIYALQAKPDNSADNLPYFMNETYQITYIHRSVEEESVSDRMARTKGFSFDRSFRSDNLYHDVFTYSVL